MFFPGVFLPYFPHSRLFAFGTLNTCSNKPAPCEFLFHARWTAVTSNTLSCFFYFSDAPTSETFQGLCVSASQYLIHAATPCPDCEILRGVTGGEDEFSMDFRWQPAWDQEGESRWWEVTSPYFASSDVSCLSPGPRLRRNLRLKCFHRWSSPQANLWCCFPFYYLLPEVMKRDLDQRRAVWSSRVMKSSEAGAFT